MSSTTTESNSVHASAPNEAPLPMMTKLAYGAPGFAGAAMAIPIAIHLTIFYSDTILVPLGFIALVKAVARALDAITDPLMGWVSDRTRTRWGRRRPWMAIGAPLAALCFYLMFAPPTDISVMEAAVWFAATYTLYYLFHTVYIIPHNGLGPELTLNYHERTMLFGIREGFVVFGTLTAAVLPPILISSLGGERQAYTGFAFIFACILTVLYLHLVWRVRERPEFMARESNPLIPGVRRVMRNRVFRLLLMVYLVGSITGAIPGLMMPYFTKYVLQPEDSNLWLAIFLAIYFGSGFCFLPIWIWAARRFEKKPVWLASFIPGVTASLALFTLGKGDLVEAAIILVWAGAGFSAGLFLGPSMQADVIDYDELYTGKRREAQYGALWSIMTKFMVIPSMSLPLAILASVGYSPNVEQSETVQFTIRAIFCLGPASTASIAFCFACFYPITKEIHQKIWDGIESHKQGIDVIDPITGYVLRPPADRGVAEDIGWHLDHYSIGELQLLVDKGTAAVRRHTAIATLLSLVALVISIFLLSGEVNIEREPGLLAVFYVVALGISFTSLIYHGMRYRVSSGLDEYRNETLKTHIRISREMKQGGLPIPLAAAPTTGS